MRTVLVFGVFDGVHEGHRSLFRQAKSLGDRVIVAVAPDEIVELLKGAKPLVALSDRIALVRKEDEVDEAFAGDSELGKYKVLADHGPDVVLLGYDQAALKEDIMRHISLGGETIEIFVADAHEPDRYHNSKINKG